MKRRDLVFAIPFVIIAALCGALSFGIASSRAASASEPLPEDQLLVQAKGSFSPLPKVFETPDNPITPDKVELGKMLFYETRISADGTISCFKCHWTNLYFTDGIKKAVGMGCQHTPRNTQTVLNSAGEISQHWIGNRATVEQQAAGALGNPGAYGLSSPAEGEQRIKAIPGYVTLFGKAFPGEKDPVTPANFGLAVGAFERTLSTPSDFDAFLEGRADALPAPAKAGLKAFMEIGCAGCHGGAPVGGLTYAKFGVTRPYWELTESEKPDEGRFVVTKNEADKYVFKVAPLRNIRMTAPYFHDGSVARLADAVSIMAALQLGKTLTGAQTGELIAFLDALTGEIPKDALVVPDSLTLGGWLAGARMWHFFGMWLFALNGAAWFVYNLLTRHGRQTTFFRRKDAPGVLPMILYYLRIRKEHPPAGKYNPLQKLAYTTIPLGALGSVLSGMSLYWPVQFGWLAWLFGGYDTARIWHFVCAGGLVLFFAGHLLMVVIAGWANFISIITGWKRVTD